MGNKFLYLDVYDSIKEKITNKEYQANDKLPTEIEMEESYNVSRITIKKALKTLKDDGLIYSKRGSGSYVAPGALWSYDNTTVENTDKSKVITMMLPFDMAESSFVNTINGASKYLCDKGYYLNVRSNISNVEEERDIINKSYENVAGILLLPMSGNENFDILNKLFIDKFPIIMIDRYNECLPINYVITDNYMGGYDATTHLIELGHKKIGFVCDVGLEKYTTLRDRYLGYCSAMENHSELSDDSIYIGFNKGYKHNKSNKMYSKIITTLIENKTTAVFAANDLLASYLITEATNMGYNVPKDISVIGFDNDPTLSRFYFKPVTTMEQAFYEIGKIAAMNLVELIEDEYKKVNIKLPATLIVKDTCQKTI